MATLREWQIRQGIFWSTFRRRLPPLLRLRFMDLCIPTCLGWREPGQGAGPLRGSPRGPPAFFVACPCVTPGPADRHAVLDCDLHITGGARRVIDMSCPSALRSRPLLLYRPWRVGCRGCASGYQYSRRELPSPPRKAYWRHRTTCKGSSSAQGGDRAGVGRRSGALLPACLDGSAH